LIPTLKEGLSIYWVIHVLKRGPIVPLMSPGGKISIFKPIGPTPRGRSEEFQRFKLDLRTFFRPY